MEKTTTKTKKVVYPEYWAKRKNRLNPKLVKELEESAANVYGLAQGTISSSEEEYRRHITAVNR